MESRDNVTRHDDEQLRRRVAELENQRALYAPREQDLAGLSAANQVLVSEIARHEALARELVERNKELACLYAISKVIETAGSSLPDILHEVVQLLPRAWQFGDVAAARISYHDQVAMTEGFEETPWLQSAALHVEGQAVGSVAVCYKVERPRADEGPFLAQERRLLDAVAERLGRTIERLRLRGHSDQLEVRLRALYDESPRPIGFARNGIFVAANPAYARLLGCESADELVGRSVLETIAPSARAEMARRIEARNRGEPVDNRYETRGLRKDGSEFPCEIHVARSDLSDGPLSAFFVEDVSQRTQAEAALARSEARFRGLVEGSCDATAIVDPSGKVVYASPNAARITGYPLGVRDGKSMLDTVHPEDQKMVLSALHRLLMGTPGCSTTVEFRGVRQDGSIWWGEATATNLVADPSIGGVVVN